VLQRRLSTRLPGYEKVARAITGDDPPAWLVKFLKMWGPCLAGDRGVAAVKLPTRVQMRKTLEGVRAAAKEPHVSGMRKEIRRHLTERKRQAEMFANA
jgi:hypothetical protein